MGETQLAIAGFEDRSRPQVKGWRQPLEAGKAKKTDSSLEAPERLLISSLEALSTPWF